MSNKPKYFAGWHELEDTVSGGTGDTIEDAVHDFIHQYAADECDFYDADDPCMVTVQVFEVISREDADRLGLGEDHWGDDWEWMTGKRIESCQYKAFQVPDKRFPGLHDWHFERVEA